MKPAPALIRRDRRCPTGATARCRVVFSASPTASRHPYLWITSIWASTASSSCNTGRRTWCFSSCFFRWQSDPDSGSCFSPGGAHAGPNMGKGGLTDVCRCYLARVHVRDHPGAWRGCVEIDQKLVLVAYLASSTLSNREHRGAADPVPDGAGAQPRVCDVGASSFRNYLIGMLSRSILADRSASCSTSWCWTSLPIGRRRHHGRICRAAQIPFDPQCRVPSFPGPFTLVDTASTDKVKLRCSF